MRNFFYLLLACLLSACVAGNMGTDTKKNGAAPQATLSHAQLRGSLVLLSGAVVPNGEPLRVLFPAGTLFTRGSVLPMAGGTGLLDGIADLLKKSNRPWQLTVRAASGEGAEYDKGLADTRVKILQTYLSEVGLNTHTLLFKAVAGEGALLEMQVL